MIFHQSPMGHRQRARWLWPLLLASGIAPAAGQEVAIDTRLQFTSQLDDNFLFQPQPQPTVLVLALSPSLTLSRNTESSTLHVDASATTYWVPARHDDDHTNLRLAMSYSLKDETNEYTASAIYARDLTVEGELQSTGVLLEPLRHNDLTINPAWTHFLSERLQAEIQISAEQSSYVGVASGSSITDFHYYAIPISLSYLATEADSIVVAGTGSYYSVDREDAHVDSGQIQVAWQHTFSDSSRYSLALGGFEARTHVGQTFTVCPLAVEFCELGLIPFVTLQSTQSFPQSGYLADTSLQYQIDEASSLAIHAARNLTPSGGGAMLVLDAFDTHYQYAFAENVSGTLGYLRAQSRFLGASTIPLNGFQSLQAGLTWQIDPFSSLEFGVRHADTFASGPAARVRENLMYTTYKYVWPESSAAQAQQ